MMGNADLKLEEQEESRPIERYVRQSRRPSTQRTWTCSLLSNFRFSCRMKSFRYLQTVQLKQAEVRLRLTECGKRRRVFDCEICQNGSMNSRNARIQIVKSAGARKLRALFAEGMATYHARKIGDTITADNKIISEEGGREYNIVMLVLWYKIWLLIGFGVTHV